MTYENICTTLINTIIAAIGGRASDARHLAAIADRAASHAGIAHVQNPLLKPVSARVLARASALAQLLVELELLAPAAVATLEYPQLFSFAGLWQELHAQGLTTPAWCAVFAGVLHGPAETTRRRACFHQGSAFWYARSVDWCPHDDTRTAVCASPAAAVQCTRLIDRGAHAERRAAAARGPATTFL